MKNFLAFRKLNSEDVRNECFNAMGSLSESDLASAMTGDKAICQMSWHDGGVEMEMVCWWKAESADAIIEQIGEMNAWFATDCKELDHIIDFNSIES